jgi:hypothetical protein
MWASVFSRQTSGRSLAAAFGFAEGITEAFAGEPENVCFSRKSEGAPESAHHCHGHRRPRLYREVILTGREEGSWWTS